MRERDRKSMFRLKLNLYIYIYICTYNKDAYIIVVSSAAVHCKAPDKRRAKITSIEKLVPLPNICNI